MVQIQRLEGFYWVARTGGYARAARAFPYPITQPAVHQQVKKLERELHTVLFERVSKDRMQLTQAGERLFRFVQPFFEGLPGVVRSLREGTYGGELRVAASGLFLRHLLPSWLARLYRQAPSVQVHVRESLTLDLEPLRRGEVDALVEHLPSPPSDVALMRVATMWPFVVLSRAHPLARRAKLALSAFQGEAFVAYNPGMLGHSLQMQALARHGVTPSRILSASSVEAILGFVEAGLGYSIIPALEPTGPRIKGLVVLPLESPKVEFPVHAVWRKDTPENPILDAFLEAAPRP